MKLHLPVFLRKSLLSCLAAFIVCTVGSGVAWAETLSFEGESLIWDTQTEFFVNEEGNAAAFTAGDNVSFSGESTVTLGEDIAAGTLAIEQGADVTIDLDVYELNVDRIELSGLLDMGYSLHIGEGTTLAVQSASAVLDSNLVLGDKGGFEVGAAASLNNNLLTLQGNTSFTLTAAGDGKTYTLLTGVSGLLDAQGNAISLDDTNNAASLYFDASQPGTGFWADATLQLSTDGTLQLVRHSEAVKPAVTIFTRRTGSVDYQYYEGVHFANIEYTLGSSSYPYAEGGAIYGGSSSNITLSNNGSVTISGNTASAFSDAYGGAIYVNYNSFITMRDNGSVTFSGNTASSSDSYSSARGGAIYVDYNSFITMRDNGSVTFSGNTASSSSSDSSDSSDYGGAIYGDDGSTITLSDNGSVVFEGNTASSTTSSAYGGAIYGCGSTITLSNNGSVVFSGNTASASYSYSACGGAIYGEGGSTITLSGNGSVTFSGNTVSSSYSSAKGGAIYGYSSSTITLSGNGSVSFSGNTGRAIYGGSSSTITLSNNGSVEFSGNTGGAIYGDSYSTITLSNNGSVEFSGNTGGAIYGDSYSTITLSNNGSVSFSGNTGGAIYGGSGSFITLSNNKGSITISGNTAESAFSDSYGGAIYGSSGSFIILSNNKGSITICGNTASASSVALGGAIYGGWSSSPITLSNNGSVTFSGNTASSSSSYAYGGAIYTQGDLSIRNNGSVLFEKNMEKSGSSYRLRSIYAGGSGDAISLSAAVGKSIEFRDSVYIDSGSTVNLNADYTYLDEEGESVTIRQTGDIIFTGADTEQYLNDLLEAAGAGRTATAQEILNSRTTEVCAMTNLYGGRLRVEEGAIYQGQGITAMEGSDATVRVLNAELSQVGYALKFNAGTALEVAGNSTIRGNVNLLADSLFKLEQAATLSLHETLQADAAELTVQGTALLTGSSTLNASLTLADGATLDMMSLDAGAVTINGALTFRGQVAMGENLLAAVEALTCWEPGLVLFTGLTNLVLPVAASELESDRVLASSVFSNVENPDLYVTYHVVDNVGSLMVMSVPEPTTTSLSLAALVALAMRRRRRK